MSSVCRAVVKGFALRRGAEKCVEGTVRVKESMADWVWKWMDYQREVAMERDGGGGGQGRKARSAQLEHNHWVRERVERRTIPGLRGYVIHWMPGNPGTSVARLVRPEDNRTSSPYPQLWARHGRVDTAPPHPFFGLGFRRGVLEVR